MSRLVRGLRDQIQVLQKEIEQRDKRLETERERHVAAFHEEQAMRMAAQRPLVRNYVRPLETFCLWLKARPEATREEIIAKLQNLFLWDIEVGYDPDQDLSLTVLSPKRMRA